MKFRQLQFSLRRLPTLTLFAVALVASAYGLSDAWHVHLGDGVSLVHGHQHIGSHQHPSGSDPAPAQAPGEIPASGPGSSYIGIASAAAAPEAGPPVEASLRPTVLDPTPVVDATLRPQVAIAPRTSRGPPA